jgi:hypothetical protein
VLALRIPVPILAKEEVDDSLITFGEARATFESACCPETLRWIDDGGNSQQRLNLGGPIPFVLFPLRSIPSMMAWD